MSSLTRVCATLIGCLMVAFPAAAHETDQFTLPGGREFADLGDQLTKTAYNAVEKGVNRVNAKIREDIAAGRSPADSQTPDAVATAVNANFPAALFLINEYDKNSQSAAWKARYPGEVVGYKSTDTVRKHIQIPLNPFNAWECATIRAFGVYLGTDKLGHFSDMGMHYYRAYRKAIKEGVGEEKALGKAIYLGTDEFIYAESGLLGWSTAGSYSNADLVSNLMGMYFYKNLTEPVMLKGQNVPPMVVRDGQYWKITPRVRPDSAFFSLFISEHFDEALNPSFYLKKFQNGIRQAIIEHSSDIVQRYVDPNGNRWSERMYEAKLAELSTYYGVNYGHRGGAQDLITIPGTCFGSVAQDAAATARDRVGRTALHRAASRGNVEAMREQLNRGADVNVQVRSNEARNSEWGNTPLHLAALDGQVEAVQYLVSRGADVNARNDRGVTPLYCAVNSPAVAQLLISKGAQINAVDSQGRTPLHWAAYDRRGQAIGTLLAAGANPNLRDHEGETPVHRAARAENVPAIEALASRGANVNLADSLGTTPLHLAAKADDPIVASALIQRGATVDAVDSFGCTPLHDAAHARGEAVVAMLIGAGATTDVANEFGVTPLQFAERTGRTEIASMIRGETPPIAAMTAGHVQPPSAGHRNSN